MRHTGAEVVWECLIREGVDVVWAYPGGAALPLFDALAKYPQIHYVLVRHEQAAAHAADGYARATGKVGVCVATSGPGATNLVTGIATAMMDSVPMVAITAQVADSVIGTDAFQEINITGITLPITKHNYLVRRERGPGAEPARGLLPGPDRPAGPGPGGHPEGHPDRPLRVPLPGAGFAPGLPSGRALCTHTRSSAPRR